MSLYSTEFVSLRDEAISVKGGAYRYKYCTVKQSPNEKPCVAVCDLQHWAWLITKFQRDQ